MSHKLNKCIFVIVVFILVLSGCSQGANQAAQEISVVPTVSGKDTQNNQNTPDQTTNPIETSIPEPTETPEPTVVPTNTRAPALSPGLHQESASVDSNYFSDNVYAESLALMNSAPLNPESPVYLQYLIDDATDITKYPQYSKKEGAINICFSNAGNNNTWRVDGFITMGEQVIQLQKEGEINNFYHYDAAGKDANQIRDIASILKNPEKCDVLIVSPNNSEAIAPAIEQACEKLPVIIFDRGVPTDCPVSYISPVGQYAYGIAGAQFIVDNLREGGNVLAFRILPSYDVLDARWGAARKIFEQNSYLNIEGVEFYYGDMKKVKSIVSDYLKRGVKIDAVWLDAGGPEVTILKAFKSAGAPYPIMIGEDRNEFLGFWKEQNLTSMATSFPVFQWRTAILAATKFMHGDTIQHRWVLPQPNVTVENLEHYYNPKLPITHYGMCGCEDMQNYPDSWKKVNINKYNKLFK
jgi:ribose transport system substrate-binding protein